jgi:integrase
MARVGLRRNEVCQVRPVDVVETDTGRHVRIWEDYSKTDSYREPPVPDEVGTMVDMRTYDMEPDDALLDVDTKTIYRWVRRAAERRQAETKDEGWSFVGPHDLRRTWGTHLLEQGVLPSVVMSWGGWEDWDTFRNHYLGEFSPEAIRRERGKVGYLGGTPEPESGAVSSYVQPPESRPRNQSADY